MSPAHRTYIPAAGWDLLLPFYDPLNRLLGVPALHNELIGQARLEPGQRLLDVDCGTGSLAVRIRREHPGVEVIGLDPDPKALECASKRATADALRFANASFDRVTSSLMLHHLELATRRGMLHEVLRVLKPGGSLHLLDFGWTGDRSDGLLARLLHSAEHLRENSDACVAALISEARFTAVERVAERRTLLGRVVFHRGRKAASA